MINWCWEPVFIFRWCPAPNSEKYFKAIFRMFLGVACGSVI